MNGLFSATPNPRAVRFLLGVTLLAVVEGMLILPCPDIPGLLRLGAAAVVLLAAVAIAVGLRGEPCDRPETPR
jgi:hypothetical protein